MPQIDYLFYLVKTVSRKILFSKRKNISISFTLVPMSEGFKFLHMFDAIVYWEKRIYPDIPSYYPITAKMMLETKAKDGGSFTMTASNGITRYSLSYLLHRSR